MLAEDNCFCSGGAKGEEVVFQTTRVAIAKNNDRYDLNQK